MCSLRIRGGGWSKDGSTLHAPAVLGSEHAAELSALLEWWAAEPARPAHVARERDLQGDECGIRAVAGDRNASANHAHRDQPGAGGNVHYNMTALVRSVDALADRLAESLRRPSPGAGFTVASSAPPAAPTVALTRSGATSRCDLRRSQSCGRRQRRDGGWSALVMRMAGTPRSWMPVRPRLPCRQEVPANYRTSSW
jgi:hypothetical protein